MRPERRRTQRGRGELLGDAAGVAEPGERNSQRMCQGAARANQQPPISCLITAHAGTKCVMSSGVYGIYVRYVCNVRRMHHYGISSPSYI